VLWRNHFVSGEWVLTTSQSGANFYTGNNPANRSGAYEPVPFVRAHPPLEEEDFRTKAESISGKHLSPRAVSWFWFCESANHIAQHPGFAAMVFWRKFILFWSNLEVPDGWSMYFIQQYSPALRMSPVTFAVLVPLAFLGALASFRTCPNARLLSGFVVAYSSSIIVFFVLSRYRVYVVPSLALLAAIGVKWVWGHVKRNELRQTLWLSALAFSWFFFSLYGASTFGMDADFFKHLNYIRLAEQYEDKKEYNKAEMLLYEALKTEPKEPTVLCALGEYYRMTGDPEKAIMFLKAGLKYGSKNAKEWFELGLSYEALRRFDDAKICFQKQLEILPEHQLAHKHLDYLLRRSTK